MNYGKSIRGILKQFFPYGFMVWWLRRTYGERIENQTSASGREYAFLRMLKYCLPYGLVRDVGSPRPPKVSRTPRPPSLTAATSPEALKLLSPRVLIIAELTIPQCKCYRVDQKVRMLRQMGVSVEVADFSNDLDCLARLQLATVVIFYRVTYTGSVPRLYAEARRLGLRIGFEVDDLIFDPLEFARNHSLLSFPSHARKAMLDDVPAYQKALAAADFSIASTKTLANFMRRYCKGPSYVVPNGVCSTGSRQDGFRFPLGLDGRVVIGYGAGSFTHNFDFATCSAAVLRILKEFPQVIFVLHGPLDLPTAFREVADRIVQIGLVPFAEYFQAISRFDINLIPLEGGAFNECKSNIKYLESSLMGVPSVVSPLPEFRSVIHDGEDGFLAETEEQWYAALRQLVLSKDLRERMGQKARENVLAHYDDPVVEKRDLRPLLDAEMPAESRGRERVLVVDYEGRVSEDRKTMEVAMFSRTANVHDAVGNLIRYEKQGMMCFQVEMPPDLDQNGAWDVADAVPAFREVVSSFRPDFVHFHSIAGLGVQLIEFCKTHGIPYLISVQDAWWLCGCPAVMDGGKCPCVQARLGIDLYQCARCTNSKTLFTRWKRLREALAGARKVLVSDDGLKTLYNRAGVDTART